MQVRIKIILFAALIAMFSGTSCAGAEPKLGSQYKIIGPMYLSGIYLKLNDRRLIREMAVASLTAVEFEGPEVAFQRKVAIGTVMTVIGPAPKRISLPFIASRYFVRLEPADLSIDLDIYLQLNRGVEGDLDGLNPKLFERVEVAPVPVPEVGVPSKLSPNNLSRPN